VASIVSAIEASGASYVFREDGARYSETLTGGPQQPLVRHTLVMEFPSGRSADDSGESADDAVDELLARSPEGFVALVSRASGERLLVGYSERFGTRYPLRVAALSSASGSVPADIPTLTLTLESCDATTSFKMNQL
jgi:hypothetical protein